MAHDYFDSLFNVGTCDQIDECLSTVAKKSLPTCKRSCTVILVPMQLRWCCSRWDQQRLLDLIQKFWHVVGDNIVIEVLDFLNSGCMTLDINHTNIVLIPKVKNLEKMPDFRPVSLCNVIYKIISKVLANWLK